MNREKTRSSLLGVAGGYLLYLAYELFRDRGNADTTMTPAARIIFIALFVIAGAALIVYAVHEWRHSGEDAEKEKAKEDESNLK